MGAALAKSNLFRGCERMPIKLKDVLHQAGLSFSDLAGGVLQSTGRPISRTAISLLINWGYYPKGTSEAAVKEQIEAFLRSRGIAEDQIASVWQPWENPVEIQQPVGRHLRALDAYLPFPEPTKRKTKAVTHPEPDFEPMEIEMLSPAAKRHFKIFRDPFLDDINAAGDVFLSEDQRYVLEAMLQTAKAGGITCVIGESGSGKSTLRKLLQHRIASEGQNIRMIFPQAFDKSKLSTGSICTAIVKDIEPDTMVRSSLEAQARQVKEVLLRSIGSGYKNLLVIEEAHNLSIPTLKYLKTFWEIEPPDGFSKALSILLIAQPEMRIKLDVARHPEAREFINRCEIASLAPLLTNLKGYIAHKLERVGVKAEAIFAEDAFDAIRDRWTAVDPSSRALKNNLYPLIVNNTVTRALNRAAELGLPMVNGDLVKEL